MQFESEDRPDLTLPEDSIHRAKLMEIEMHSFDWTDRSGDSKSSEVLNWWWEIVNTRDPKYIGRRVKGTCPPYLNNRPDNRFRIWSEAILGREIPVGMKIDTDDLVGCEADIVIGHRPDRKNPHKIWEFVSDVAGVENRQDEDPPF